MHFSTETLRDSLSTHLTKAAHAGLTLKQANSDAARLTGTSYVRFYWTDYLNAALKQWLEPLCSEVTEKFSEGTGNSLHVSHLPETLNELPSGTITNWNGSTVNQSQLDEHINTVIAAYPFDSLSHTLQQKIESIEREGFTKIANSVAEKLNLRCYNNGRVFFKTTKRHICFDLTLYPPDHGHYDYREKEKFHQLLTGLKFIERQIGNVGLVPAFEALNEHIQAGTPVSKYNYGNTNTLLIKGFKSHIRIQMTPDVLDALMCFLAIHTSEDVNLKQPDMSALVAA